MENAQPARESLRDTVGHPGNLTLRVGRRGGRGAVWAATTGCSFGSGGEWRARAGYAANAQCDAAWLAVLIASGYHVRNFAFGKRRC